MLGRLRRRARRIHGAGSSALVWADAAERLAGIGRVIAYDRRGCARSERPEPYERTSVAESVLDPLGATPALVIRRSYGGTIAIDVALRHPDPRAVVGLEPDGSREMAPAAAAWVDAFADRMRAVAARDGVHALGEALVTEVGGQDAWRSLPDEVRGALAGNGPAILAELAGEWWLPADAGTLATSAQPVLLVSAADSPPEFHEAAAALRPRFRTLAPPRWAAGTCERAAEVPAKDEL